MSYPQYDQWRRARLERTVRIGQPLDSIPSSAKLKKAAGGSWYTVKALAKVPGAEALAETGRWYTDDEIAAAVRMAAASMPGNPGEMRPGQYKKWRDAAVAEARAQGRDARLPVVEHVRAKLGGEHHEWETALARALEGGIGA